MVGEKFFQNISALSTTELNTCIRFSKIEAFNRRQEVTVILELYKKNKNKFFSLLLEEKKLFLLLFPNEKAYMKKDLADCFHYCLNFLEDFVVYNVSHNDKEKRLEILEGFYAERRVEKEFLALNKKRIKIEKSKKISVESNLKLYLMHKAKFYFLIKDFDNEVFEELNIAIDYLDKYFYLSKMIAFQELSSNSLMSNVEYEHTLKEEIFEIINNDGQKNDNVVSKIFSITVQLYNKDFDKERYIILKKLVLDNIKSFDTTLKRNVLGDMSNYVSYLYNKEADNNLIKESFEIIKLGILHKVFIENNTFPESTFSQDIRVAIYLKEFDWAEKFIETHKKYLKNKDLVLVSKAEILYSQAKYSELYESIEKLAQNKRSDGYDVKCLYAKALYDEKKYDELDSFLTKFSLSLRRKKENSKEILASKNGFVLYLQRIIKHLHSETRLRKLLKELDENKQVFHRNWLFSRLNILLKK